MPFIPLTLCTRFRFAPSEVVLGLTLFEIPSLLDQGSSLFSSSVPYLRTIYITRSTKKQQPPTGPQNLENRRRAGDT